MRSRAQGGGRKELTIEKAEMKVMVSRTYWYCSRVAGTQTCVSLYTKLDK